MKNVNTRARTSLLATVAAIGMMAMANSASATVVQVDPSRLNNLSNVLFDNGETGNTLFGDLNSGPTNAVSFTSTSSQMLTAQGSGQARIMSTMGSLTNLTFMPTAMDMGFTGVEFNINAVNQTSGSVMLTALDQFGKTFTFGLNVGNGENRFAFQGINNEVIRSISLSAASGLIADVRQVRVGTTVAVPGPIAGAGLPALMGLAGLFWARRRRHAAVG